MGTTTRVTRGEMIAADLRAAALNDMDRQKLSDRVHRYNAEGIEDLKSSSGGARPLTVRDYRHARMGRVSVSMRAGTSKSADTESTECIPSCTEQRSWRSARAVHRSRSVRFP